PALKAVTPAAEILLRPELGSGFDPEEGARLISPVEQLPSPPSEPPSHFTVEAPTIVPPIVPPTIARPAIVRPVREPQRPDRPAGWRWRAALTFASVVLLALVLG